MERVREFGARAVRLDCRIDMKQRVALAEIRLYPSNGSRTR
jgi:hypothetical protein